MNAPQQAEQAAVAVTNANPNVTLEDFAFRFKKDKLGNQRPSFKVKGQVPSFEGVVKILQTGGKGLELLHEVINSTIRDAIAADVGDDEGFNQETYDKATIKVGDVTLPKYSWEAIANAPRVDRRVIDPAIWEVFASDYMEVMLAVSGKGKEAIALALSIFQKKFSQVKTNKEVLEKLKTNLAIYVDSTKKGEEVADVLELLTSRLDTYLKAEEPVILAENL